MILHWLHIEYFQLKVGRRKQGRTNPIPQKFLDLIEVGKFSVDEEFLEQNPNIGLVDGVLFGAEWRQMADPANDHNGCPDFFSPKMVCSDWFCVLTCVRCNAENIELRCL